MGNAVSPSAPPGAAAVLPHISRRTFYEWRAKNRAPKCIALPTGSLRIRRSDYQRWLAAREEAA